MTNGKSCRSTLKETTVVRDIKCGMDYLGLHCCKGTFSSCSEWGLLSSCSAWASHCGGFSWGAQARQMGFSSCGAQA